jgi:lipopolysaccharide transport system ATP-binding protein
MGAVSQTGRTVLFVSHNLAAVRSLCSRALLIERGRIAQDGAVGEVIEAYLNRGLSQGRWSWSAADRPGSKALELSAVELEGERSGVAGCVQADEELRIALHYTQLDECPGCRFVFQLLTASGEVAFTSTDQRYREMRRYAPGRYRTTCTIPARLLNRGNYSIRVWAGIAGVGQLVKPVDVGQFAVEGVSVSGSLTDRNWPGAVSPDLHWDVVEERSPATMPAE